MHTQGQIPEPCTPCAHPVHAHTLGQIPEPSRLLLTSTHLQSCCTVLRGGLLFALHGLGVLRQLTPDVQHTHVPPCRPDAPLPTAQVYQSDGVPLAQIHG